MASLNQGSGGLGFKDFDIPKPAPKRKRPETNLSVQEHECKGCGYRAVQVIETRSRKQSRHLGFLLHAGLCADCAAFFGSGDLPGVTNWDPERSRKKVLDIKEAGYCMVLRNLHLTAPDGNVLNLGAGDIFVCNPGNPTLEDVADQPASREKTWSLYVIDLHVGPYSTRLFPHEYAPISLPVIMDLKRRGEVCEAYLSPDDKIGHFAVSDAMREQIQGAFGRLVGD